MTDILLAMHSPFVILRVLVAILCTVGAFDFWRRGMYGVVVMFLVLLVNDVLSLFAAGIFDNDWVIHGSSALAVSALVLSGDLFEILDKPFKDED